MNLGLEEIINIIAAIIGLGLFIFVVDWRYFRDWIVVFLFKGLLDFICGSPVRKLNLIEYPIRLLPHYYDTSILFELWIFPILCILYNQALGSEASGLLSIMLYCSVRV